MDYFLFQQINNLAGRWASLDVVGIFSAKYLGYVLAVFIILIVFLPAGRQGRKWKIISQVFLAAIVARLGFVEFIRWFWAKQRPFIDNNVNLLLEHSKEPAFPSGHAAFFFALSFIVYKYNKKIGIWFFIASSLISISRVFVGVHWPSDILAGALVGILSGWLMIKIFKRFFN